jgi:hypothetical protein
MHDDVRNQSFQMPLSWMQISLFCTHTSLIRYIHTHIHTYIHTSMHAWCAKSSIPDAFVMNVNIPFLHTYIAHQIYIHTHTYIHTYKHACMICEISLSWYPLYMCVCACVCLYIYIYIYIYIYTHTHKSNISRPTFLPFWPRWRFPLFENRLAVVACKFLLPGDSCVHTLYTSIRGWRGACTSAYMHVCMYVCMLLYIEGWRGACTSAYVCVCMYVCWSIYKYPKLTWHMYIRIHACVCVCDGAVHTYKYKYVHVYTHMGT